MNRAIWEISVTASDPNLIYILASGAVGVDGGLYGIYKSTDAGESFTFECCDGAPGGVASVTNPNILGWSEDGTGEGGQYYYDLAMGASPTDADRLFGAGINVWRSTDAGAKALAEAAKAATRARENFILMVC